MKTINNFYGAVNQYFYDSSKLDLITQKLENMDQNLEQVKQQLIETNTNLATANTKLDNIQGDLTTLNNKIQELSNAGTGATPEQIAELLALSTQALENSSTVANKATSLDEQTPAP